jgi:hypothetical protein|tara:strand:+ start:626 stop:1741 length:1116 start_codon:yes stop_codon:yes gene_type:complete
MNKLLIFIIVILTTFVISNKIAKNYTKSSIKENNFHKNILEMYGEKNYSDYLEMINFQSIPSKYSPFTESLEKERYSKFLSVGIYSNRCNYNEITSCKAVPKGGDDEIWIFGGSEIFGYGLKNNETIAAYLEKLFINKKVINFGQGFFYSTQNRILFQNLLTFIPPPNTVIFMEGFNDFKREHILNYQFPGITSVTKDYEKIIQKKKYSRFKIFKQWINTRYNRLNLVKLYKERSQRKNKNQNKKAALDADIDQKYKILINRLITNFKINKSLENTFKIKIINVLEPIPLTKNAYTNSKILDEDLSKYDNHFFHYKNIYDLLGKNNNLLDYVDLNLINLKIKDEMFINLTHYSSKFSNEIAYNLYKFMNNQ